VDSGYVAYRGTTPLEVGSTGSHLTEVRAWFGPGLHLVQYPLRGGTMYNQVAVFRSERFLAGEDEWGTPDELDEAFSVTCEAVQKALPGLWRHQWWHMADRLPMTNWAEGRLALLGDAAHPMLQYLAQGACQAIEDGAELAKSLAHVSTSPEKVSLALKRYAEARIPRTAQVQRTARIWGEIWHIEGLGASLRNELFRQRAAEDMSRVDWLYGPAAGA
jgi:salicylate hydroxylase